MRRPDFDRLNPDTLHMVAGAVRGAYRDARRWGLDRFEARMLAKRAIHTADLVATFLPFPYPARYAARSPVPDDTKGGR